MNTRISLSPLNRVLPALLFGASVLTPVAAARADNLDEELMRQGPHMMKYIREHGYQNVGVQTFTFQRGTTKPTLAAGLINQNIAERMERALVLALNPEEKPIGIITNASAVAKKGLKGASYRTAADRARLFTIQYPLAWGTPPQRVNADAFLVGKVTLSPDLRTTRMLVAAFGRNDPKSMDKIAEFEVRSDRYILTDAGQGFSLSKGKGNFRRGGTDEEIFTAVSEDQQKVKEDAGRGREPKPTQNPAATSEFPVELQINYDGAPQEMQPDADTPGPQNWTILDPKEGQKVTFSLRNKTDSTLGVILAVNGISTLYQEGGQPNQMTRWVLEPGKEYLIKGYYQQDKGTYKEIVGFSDEVTQRLLSDPQTPQAAGLIHLYVFRAGNQSSTASSPAFSRSLRRVNRSTLKVKGPAKTPAELKQQIASGANLRGGRGFMGPSGTDGSEELQEQALGNVVLTDTLVIRYFKKQ